MTHVRRHERITKGRAVSVRSHERAIPERHGTDTVWDDGTWDEQRYLERAEFVEAQPDVTGLLTDEAYDRDATAADDAAQRMIAERLSDDEQWAWVEPEPESESEPSATCPACGGTFPVDVGGTLQGHRIDGPDYCPGSGLTEKQISRYKEAK